MYPNLRVNKRERDEILFGSLGNKPIDTSSLAVEEIPVSDDRLAEVGKQFSGHAEEMRGLADADVAAKSKAMDDFAANGGMSPSGKVYRTPTGKLPLDDDTEQLLSDARQPLSGAGPYENPRTAGRWDNLRKSMPPKNDSVPLKPSEVTPEMMDEGRKANAHLYPSHVRATLGATSGVPGQGKAGDNSAALAEAKRIHEAGKANIAAGEAARPQVAHNAQVDAVLRRGRLAGAPVNPLMGSLFVGAGLGRPQASQAMTMTGDHIDTGAPTPGSQPMNPAMQALFPDLAKTQMQTAAAGTAARERNAVDMRTADSAEKTQKIQAVGQLVQIEDAEFDRKISMATNDQERMALQDQKLANKRMRQNQIASLAGIDALGPKPSSSPLDSIGVDDPTWRPRPGDNSIEQIKEAARNGQIPGMPIGASQPAPAVPAQPSGSFPTPRDNSPEAMRQAASGFQPNFADLWAASPFADQKLGPLHSGQYKPGLDSFDDANKNGQWDQGEIFTSPEAAKYHMGKTAAGRMVQEMESFLGANAPSASLAAPTGVADTYRALKSRFGQYGDDAIRWAMAKHFGRPEWIESWQDYNNWISAAPVRGWE